MGCAGSRELGGGEDGREASAELQQLQVQQKSLPQVFLEAQEEAHQADLAQQQHAQGAAALQAPLGAAAAVPGELGPLSPSPALSPQEQDTLLVKSDAHPREPSASQLVGGEEEMDAGATGSMRPLMSGAPQAPNGRKWFVVDDG